LRLELYYYISQWDEVGYPLDNEILNILNNIKGELPILNNIKREHMTTRKKLFRDQYLATK